jgi:hypothetical protein
MILDIAAADLEVAEVVHGPFHPTAWHFRQALADARRSWDRLRAEFGGRVLEAALAEPPVAVLTLGEDGRLPATVFLPIAGKTYRAERLKSNEIVRVLWRLTRLPHHENGPYYACRLQDGTTQCDCAEWVYHVSDTTPDAVCKHLAALVSLGWV